MSKLVANCLKKKIQASFPKQLIGQLTIYHILEFPKSHSGSVYEDFHVNLDNIK